MSATKFKSHEQSIFDATSAAIFALDLSDEANKAKALTILEGSAFALEAIGSKFVQAPLPALGSRADA